MLNKSTCAIVLAGAALPASYVAKSAGLMAAGTAQVTSWQKSVAGQLSTSEEAGHSAVLVPVVTSFGGSALLAPVSLTPDAWQLVLACLAMAAFALVTILRRLRHSQRSSAEQRQRQHG